MSGEKDEDVTIVLILPELLGALHDSQIVRGTLVSHQRPMRILVSVLQPPHPTLFAYLIAHGIKFQVLLAPRLPKPRVCTREVNMPPGSDDKEQTRLALALADIVLVGVGGRRRKEISDIAALGKTVIEIGEVIPDNPLLPPATHRLDPEVPGWHMLGRCIFGRFEQAASELFAFRWHSSRRGRDRLRRSFYWKWDLESFFGPRSRCRRFAPDTAVIDPKTPMVRCFDALDRSALHGSYIHRDFVWWKHLGAAAAVFLAVAGKVFEHKARFEWAELGMLVFVALLVLFARLTHLQDRWTGCRLGAEQLRIARMALPLFVLPPALATSDKPEPGFGDEKTKFQFLALTQVKRAIRKQGLPQVETHPLASFYLTARLARIWVQVIVSNQIVYHHRNHRLLHREERHLHLFTQMVFGLAIVAVVSHFWVESELLLLATAAGPAFAAALHGVGTRLGLVHRVALSREVERSLQRTGRALRALGRNPPSDDETWREMRRLTLEAVSSMGQENTSWHGLVRRYRDDLP